MEIKSSDATKLKRIHDDAKATLQYISIVDTGMNATIEVLAKAILDISDIKKARQMYVGMRSYVTIHDGNPLGKSKQIWSDLGIYSAKSLYRVLNKTKSLFQEIDTK